MLSQTMIFFLSEIDGSQINQERIIELKQEMPVDSIPTRKRMVCLIICVGLVK